MKCANSSWETQLDGKLCWAIVLSLLLGWTGGMHPVNNSTVSTSQQVNNSKCWNSQEIVAVDLCSVIHFKGRSLESNFKKQEQQLLCESKERWYQDKVVNIILRYLEMEWRQDDVKAGLGCLEDIFIACGCYAQGHKCGLLSLSFWLRQEITDHNWSLFERQQDRVGRKALKQHNTTTCSPQWAALPILPDLPSPLCLLPALGKPGLHVCIKREPQALPQGKSVLCVFRPTCKVC